MRYLVCLLVLVFLLGSSFLWAQVSGDYRSKASGNWSAIGTWQTYNGSAWADATVKPGSSNSVYVQSGHIVTLTGSEACNNLHISKGTSTTNATNGRVALTSHTLDLYGKLRTYYAAVGTIPGTSTTTMANMLITCTTSNGKIVVSGSANHALTLTGEWSDGSYTTPPTGQRLFNMEINADSGVVITMNTTIRAYSWNIVSGTLNVAAAAQVHADTNVLNQGDVTVSTDAVLVVNSTSTTNSVIRRKASYRGGTFQMSGLMRVMGTNTGIAMSTVVFDGTVEYGANGAQNFIVAGGNGSVVPNTYTNLLISGSGAKTMNTNITVNGDLGYAGTATLNKGTYSISEGDLFTISKTLGATSPLFIDLPLYKSFDTDVTISWTGGGSYTGTARVSYQPEGVDLPVVGLVMEISGFDLSGMHLKIRHGLGFKPIGIAYRLKDDQDEWGDWHSVTSTLDATYAEFDVGNAKGMGDIQMAFPLTEDDTLPITLSSFTGTISSQNYVVLHWTTQSEMSLMGYYIWRNSSNAITGAVRISPMIEATNTSSQTSYEFADTELNSQGAPNGYCYYWLQVVSMDSGEMYQGPVAVYYTPGTVTPPPEALINAGLNSIFPNPASSLATIFYGVDKSSDVSFTVYNTRGQMIRELHAGAKDKGNWNQNWDGLDNHGQLCPTGIYYVVMHLGSEHYVRKLVIVR